jgi:predicted small lipoprotein YifL
MKSYRNRFSGHLPAAILALSVLLAACGQTGSLYMPESHSIPPPPPRESRAKKEAQKISHENAVNGTDETNQDK